MDFLLQQFEKANTELRHLLLTSTCCSKNGRSNLRRAKCQEKVKNSAESAAFDTSLFGAHLRDKDAIVLGGHVVLLGTVFRPMLL